MRKTVEVVMMEESRQLKMRATKRGWRIFPWSLQVQGVPTRHAPAELEFNIDFPHTFLNFRLFQALPDLALFQSAHT